MSNAGDNNEQAMARDLWESEQPVDRALNDPDFTVDVDGFEGPLDLLLAMARTQKVDLTKISILDLAMQYLEFVEKARTLRLELAADYLVMAAWLAYLKSRLLLPAPEGDEEPTGEELAAQLAFRLQRLEAMREAANSLMNRNRLGQHIFARGDPEPVVVFVSSDTLICQNGTANLIATATGGTNYLFKVNLFLFSNIVLLLCLLFIWFLLIYKNIFHKKNERFNNLFLILIPIAFIYSFTSITKLAQ